MEPWKERHIGKSGGLKVRVINAKTYLNQMRWLWLKIAACDQINAGLQPAG